MWVHNTGSRCVGEEIAAKMVVENHISRFFFFFSTCLSSLEPRRLEIELVRISLSLLT